MSATLPDLQVVWPTRSRTGSQFVLQLTAYVRGGMAPQARINGNRNEGYKPEEKHGDFRELWFQGRGHEYLADNAITSMKYEDPGKDDFVRSLLAAAPNAVFVASHRPIERVLESHHNIKTWGHGEADVLHQMSGSLTLYEELAAAGRLFLVDVDDRTSFDPDAFCRFLGVDKLNSRAGQLIEEWAPINDLKYQVERAGKEFTARERPPRVDRLRQIHSWLDDHEQRYAALVERSASH